MTAATALNRLCPIGSEGQKRDRERERKGDECEEKVSAQRFQKYEHEQANERRLRSSKRSSKANESKRTVLSVCANKRLGLCLSSRVVC